VAELELPAATHFSRGGVTARIPRRLLPPASISSMFVESIVLRVVILINQIHLKPLHYILLAAVCSFLAMIPATVEIRTTMC
jgi:hypothetical protein